MLALRTSGQPLKPPPYIMMNVPRCSKDLGGSVIQEVTERQHFTDSMAEMVLLCNEVMRRQQNNVKKKTAKPLSLEYIYDRIDVDDPISGFFVRTAVPPLSNLTLSVNGDATVKDYENEKKLQTSGVENDQGTDASKWVEGMMQGFIVVTTFTNWKKSFRWDSTHDSAFAYDEEELGWQMLNGVRKYDSDGRLAEELEALVRCGDPWNEGIVWPRIAEISLLGGLGCGRALLSLVVEKLECMPPSATHNYDYVVLQATHNSIGFYESMGFVRVGAIIEDDKFEEKRGNVKTNSADDEDARHTDEVSKTPTSEVVSSAVETYVAKKDGETPINVAKAFGVDVWDIIFLNHFVYPDIAPRSYIYKGTSLFYPSKKAKDNAISNAMRNKQGESSAIQWYICEENDTPKSVANRFKVKCRDVVNANVERLPGLTSTSRLKRGTKLQASNFHIHHDKHIPYCHWTFPDDTFETSEPSYMMVKKLNRRHGAATKHRPVQSSFAAPIIKYYPKKIPHTPSELSVHNETTPGKGITKIKASSKKQKMMHPDEPIPPKKPMPAYFFFMMKMREVLKDELAGKPVGDVAKILSAKWKELPGTEKSTFEDMATKAKIDYKKAMDEYNSKMDAFRQSHSEYVDVEMTCISTPFPKDTMNDESSTGIQTVQKEAKPKEFFNKVVKLNVDGAKKFGTEYDYYYVLTYLPDLQWCHLAPMVTNGNFGVDEPQAEGRARWVLVDENEGKEIDVSASFCELVRAKEMKKATDADEEEWDIIDDKYNNRSWEPSLNKFKNGENANEKTILSGRPLATPFTNRAKDGVPTKIEHEPVQVEVVEREPHESVRVEVVEECKKKKKLKKAKTHKKNNANKDIIKVKLTSVSLDDSFVLEAAITSKKNPKSQKKRSKRKKGDADDIKDVKVTKSKQCTLYDVMFSGPMKTPKIEKQQTKIATNGNVNEVKNEVKARLVAPSSSPFIKDGMLENGPTTESENFVGKDVQSFALDHWNENNNDDGRNKAESSPIVPCKS